MTIAVAAPTSTHLIYVIDEENNIEKMVQVISGV